MKTKARKPKKGTPVYRGTIATCDVLVPLEKLKYSRYRVNPIVLAQHNPTRAIGQALTVEVTDAGIETEFVFADSSDGQEMRGKWESGLYRAMSMGVAYDEVDPDGKKESQDRKWEFQLGEISIVAVPLDKGAVVTSGRPLREATAATAEPWLPVDDDGNCNPHGPVILQAAANGQPVRTIKNEPDQIMGDPKTTTTTTQAAVAPELDVEALQANIVTQVTASLGAMIKATLEKMGVVKEGNDDPALRAAQATPPVQVIEEDPDVAPHHRAKIHGEHVANLAKLKEREDRVKQRESEAAMKLAEHEVRTTAHRYGALLPRGYTARGQTVRQVLEAACGKEVLYYDRTDDYIRGQLDALLERREQARYDAGAGQPPVTSAQAANAPIFLSTWTRGYDIDKVYGGDS